MPALLINQIMYVGASWYPEADVHNRHSFESIDARIVMVIGLLIVGT